MTSEADGELPSYGNYADNSEEAARRFAIACDCDPFPDIPPALLNSADIADYVNQTGMIEPFHPDSLKSASYEIAVGGELIYWDEEGEKHFSTIEKGDTFVLKRNSIAFVSVEPTFRLPNYIALRFNLRIEHVHRGILLGTGPLVDPGFEGKLLIPLHNLTTNAYKFVGGESLIWVEFTKVSPHRRWHSRKSFDPNALFQKATEFIPFPDAKKYKDASYYLPKASPHSPIRSSIPDEFRKAQREAKEASEKAVVAARNAGDARDSAGDARDRVASIRRRITNFGMFGGAVALLVGVTGLLALWTGINQLAQESNSLANQIRDRQSTLETKYDENFPRLSAIENRARDARAKLDNVIRLTEMLVDQIRESSEGDALENIKEKISAISER